MATSVPTASLARSGRRRLFAVVDGRPLSSELRKRSVLSLLEVSKMDVCLLQGRLDAPDVEAKSLGLLGRGDPYRYKSCCLFGEGGADM